MHSQLWLYFGMLQWQPCAANHPSLGKLIGCVMTNRLEPNDRQLPSLTVKLSQACVEDSTRVLGHTDLLQPNQQKHCCDSPHTVSFMYQYQVRIRQTPDDLPSSLPRYDSCLSASHSWQGSAHTCAHATHVTQPAPRIIPPPCFNMWKISDKSTRVTPLAECFCHDC